MQAIILAAGKGTRMLPLSCKRPKHLLTVANKSVIEHNLDQLIGIVDEAIIVIGYQGEQIREHLGDNHKGMALKYAVQAEQLGTGHALLCAAPHVTGRFVILPCDDMFSRADILRCVAHRYCALAKQVENPAQFGVFVVEGKRIADIEEKPQAPKSDLANTGLWVMDTKLIDAMRSVPKSVRGEYEITDALLGLIRTEEVVCEEVRDFWLPIGYPWDLLDANAFFVNRIEESAIHGTVEDNVIIKGRVVLGDGSELLAGTYIEGNVMVGKGSKIGPNCYIRGPVCIGDGCRVGQAVELKNCVLFDKAKVPHLSYFGDSVIGERSNIGAGSIVANLRHDGGNIRSKVGDKLVDTNRRKFGTAIGDDVHTGIKTLIYPGRKIWAGKTTLPGDIIKEDLV